MTRARIITLFCIPLLGAGAAQADWLEQLMNKAQALKSAPAAQTAAAALSDEEIVRGLKEALAQGSRQAIDRLGKAGGYLNDPNVRIPMPDDLQKVEKLLRTLKQDKVADEFVASLNHAAERAVPEAAAIIGDSLAKMTLEDARGILKGPDDAATQYFRKTGEAQIRARFMPIVRQATAQVGVTSAYKRLMQRAGPYAQLMGSQATDLDGYVTDKAMDGLFKMVAEEEKRIRQDPLARTTDLLKKVFGAVVK
jgi:hypothetical protein